MADDARAVAEGLGRSREGLVMAPQRTGAKSAHVGRPRNDHLSRPLTPRERLVDLRAMMQSYAEAMTTRGRPEEAKMLLARVAEYDVRLAGMAHAAE